MSSALPSGATAAAVTNTMWAFLTRCTALSPGVETAMASPSDVPTPSTPPLVLISRAVTAASAACRAHASTHFQAVGCRCGLELGPHMARQDSNSSVSLYTEDRVVEITHRIGDRLISSTFTRLR